MSDSRKNDKGDEKAQVERGKLMVVASKNQQQRPSRKKGKKLRYK